MTLEFVSQYKSIKNFDAIDLGDFSIFTGKNGSGKTQLLQAIKNGNVTFDSFKPEEIIYFNLSTFRTSDTQFTSEQNEIPFFTTAYNNFRSMAESSKSQYPLLTDLESNNLNKILEDENKSLFEINEKEIDNKELWKKLETYQNTCQTLFAQNYFNHIIISIIKTSKNFFHNISNVEFQTKYAFVSSKNDLILTELGMLFYDYQIKLYEERDRIYSTIDESMTKGQIEKIIQNKYNARFGGMPPWDAINKILESYSDMNHKLIEPQKIGLSQLRKDLLSFPVVIKVKSTNAEIIPDDLSSGESVLFALALSVFKENISSSLLKVLLLDEIDATLHPTMIKNLLRVIDEIFVERGVKVILATHSPTTVALCKEKPIFIIDNSKSQLIQPQPPQNALDKLTDGFVTIEKGLGLLNMISDKEITIVTEGKNTQYIQKAMEIFTPENKDKIDILRDIEHNSSNTILKTLFDFFSEVKHEQKFIFVFDPDCEEYRNILHEKNNTYFYILEKSKQNTMPVGGIETMFDDKFFGRNDLTIPKSGKYKGKEIMTNNRKPSFMKRMIEIADKDNFEKFKPLFDRLGNIL